MKLADIIIPHHNRHELLTGLLSRIDNTAFNIIIVSGGSFAENCNKGARLAETNKLIFVNDDTLPWHRNFIDMVFELDVYDFVGCTQLVQDAKLKYYGIGFIEEDGKIIPDIMKSKEGSLFPSGFFFGVTKEKWEELGGLEENFKTGYEDVDFGLRALQTNTKITIIDSEIVHLESQSEGRFKYCEYNTELLHNMYSQDYLKNIKETTKDCI